MIGSTTRIFEGRIRHGTVPLMTMVAACIYLFPSSQLRQLQYCALVRRVLITDSFPVLYVCVPLNISSMFLYENEVVHEELHDVHSFFRNTPVMH